MPSVTSADGTSIGYELQGTGPAVILVDGALGYRGFGNMGKVAALVASRFTAIAYDRRGRGESGDTLPYALEREIEDIDALIGVIGDSASLCGTSSGGCLALEATFVLGGRIDRLAMYEPAYNAEDGGDQAWTEYSDRLDVLLAEGRSGDAVALFMSFVGTPAHMIEGMRGSPMWAQLEAVAPTLAYDRAAIGPDQKPPLDRARSVQVPTLVVNGGNTVPFLAHAAKLLADAIPDARHLVLEGQAHDVAPEALAAALTEFLAD